MWQISDVAEEIVPLPIGGGEVDDRHLEFLVPADAPVTPVMTFAAATSPSARTWPTQAYD